MLCKLFAVSDSFKIAFKVGPDHVSHRDAVFHIEKEFLHRCTSNGFNTQKLVNESIMGFNPMDQLLFDRNRHVGEIKP
jgi:hypothetical protein